MSTLNCCTDTVLPTVSPLPQRWIHDMREWLNQRLHSWRVNAALHAQQRTISELSDSTLRDIGLAERRLHEPTLGVIDWERGRW